MQPSGCANANKQQPWLPICNYSLRRLLQAPSELHLQGTAVCLLWCCMLRPRPWQHARQAGVPDLTTLD